MYDKDLVWHAAMNEDDDFFCGYLTNESTFVLFIAGTIVGVSLRR